MPSRDTIRFPYVGRIRRDRVHHRPRPALPQDVPFGLKNMGATYQLLMNKLFEALIRKTMEVYVDDMIVKSMLDETHSPALRQTFNILRAFRMKLNLKKCVFGVRSSKFLEFIISSWGIEANIDKIQAILDMRPLRNIKEVK